MKKKILLLSLFFIFSFGFHPLYGEPGSGTQFKTEPGGIVALRFPGNDIYWDGEAQLLDTEGTPISRAPLFTKREESSRELYYHFIIGIPTTIPPGIYSLYYRLEGLSAREGRVSVELSSRDFIAEDIPLNGDLTAIRSEPDPRKEQEAIEFFRILNSPRRSAVFADESHILPLTDFIQTSFFGDRRRYLYNDGRIARSIHTGMDLAAPRGTPVYASGSGKVVFAAPRIITGKTIIIEHLPGVFGIYYHLDDLEVIQGDYVKKGDVIGTVGSTGLSTGNHLHWEIRIGETVVDPKNFLHADVLDKAYILGKHVGTR